MNAAKENTFRALREEELLVTFWGCRFGIHKWTKYREPDIVREGRYEYQRPERRCGFCNVANRKVLHKD